MEATNIGYFKEKEYQIIADVGMGICLPSNSSKYKVKIKIGESVSLRFTSTHF